MPEPIQLRYIRSREELDAFRPHWQRLWRQDVNATPFQSPEWLIPWWHCFGDGDLRAIVLLRNEAVIGFLPFYTYPEPRSGERRLLLLGVGTSDYLDGVFASGCTTADVLRALDALWLEEGWDAMYISQLRAGSILMQALEQGLKTNGASIPGESCSRMPAVSMSALPQKIKRNAMYYRNRALRQGNLELLVSDASNCGGMFEALVRLHTDRWRSCGQLGVFADQRVIQWHREAVPQLEQAGILRLCSLLLNGTTIGVLYSLVDPQERAQRTQYFYLPAYSVEHADLRPGTLLTALAVEAAAREGVKTIDMLRGDEEYKRIWHTERFPTCGFFLRKTQARELAA